MFIAGYVVGGLLIVNSALDFMLRSMDETNGIQETANANSELIIAILFVGGCLILLISRIGHIISNYIRKQMNKISD